MREEVCDCDGNQSNNDKIEAGGPSASVVVVIRLGNNNDVEFLEKNGNEDSVEASRANRFMCEKSIESSAARISDFHKQELAANEVGDVATDRWQGGDWRPVRFHGDGINKLGLVANGGDSRP